MVGTSAIFMCGTVGEFCDISLVNRLLFVGAWRGQKNCVPWEWVVLLLGIRALAHWRMACATHAPLPITRREHPLD